MQEDILMSKSETMYIAFPYGGILPADVAGGDEKKVGPHDPVKVPRTYGEHLIEDRFAYRAEAPKARKNEGGRPPVDLAALEDAVKTAEAAASAAADDSEKAAAEADLAKARDDLAKARG